MNRDLLRALVAINVLDTFNRKHVTKKDIEMEINNGVKVVGSKEELLARLLKWYEIKDIKGEH